MCGGRMCCTGNLRDQKNKNPVPPSANHADRIFIRTEFLRTTARLAEYRLSPIRRIATARHHQKQSLQKPWDELPGLLQFGKFHGAAKFSSIAAEEIRHDVHARIARVVQTRKPKSRFQRFQQRKAVVICGALYASSMMVRLNGEDHLVLVLGRE